MTKMDFKSNEVQKFKILRPNEKLNGVVNGTSTASNNEDFDNSARIFKSINDVQRFLEVKRSKASTVLDLFTTSLEAQRMRLKSYCERLMFKDPLAYGREAKDILWKKCYYDVINTAKHLRKDVQWQPDELSCLQIHLQSGIGHYHHILKRFQQEFNVSFTERKSKGSSVTEVEEWVYNAIYCCLIHLGDLSRYKLDIYPRHNMGLAACYYYQALYWRPQSGLPHNQLATLYNVQGVYIDQAYHYYRCLNSPKPFEGTSCNLRILADKNKLRMKQNSSADSIPLYKLLVEHFVFISYALYYDQPLKNEVKDTFVSYVECCLSDMPTSKDSSHAEFEDATGECSTLMSYTHIDCTQLLPWIQRTVQRAQDQSLDSRSLMKMMATLFLLCYRAKKHNSKKYELHMSLTFRLMHLITEYTVNRLVDIIDLKTNQQQESSRGSLEEEEEEDPSKTDGALLLSHPEQLKCGSGGDDDVLDVDDDDGIKKILGGCRRRRLRRRIDSDDESLSDLKEVVDKSFKDPTLVGEDSEEEILFDVNTSDEEGDRNLRERVRKMKLNGGARSPSEVDKDDTGSLTESCFNEKESQGVALKSFIQLCETESLVQTIRLFVDWLSFDKNVLLYPSSSFLPFVKSYARLLNIVRPIQIPLPDKTGPLWALTPLEEDLELRGMPPFHHIHYAFNWSELKITRASQVTQAAIRISRLKSFGDLACTPGVDYLRLDASEQAYKVNEERQVHEKLQTNNNNNSIHQMNGGGGGDHQNGGVDAKLLNGHHKSSSNGHSIDKEDNLVLNLSTTHNMTQVSNNSSPNHFVEDADKFAEDEDDPSTINGKYQMLLPNEDLANESPSDELLSPPNGKNGSTNLRLMQDMGQLWLKSEVTQIESRIKQNNSSAMSLPPYLVLDTEALAAQPYLVKQLVYTKKFIVLIPSVVIQDMDELKRTSGRVRDTIRWLEVQLRSGNRFLRAQRLGERKEIPFIKYPKKKDKEAWNMYQILECCYYLTSKTKVQDQNVLSNDTTTKSPNMVTLLTGYDKQNLQFGASGVALSAGIDVENIISFYSNWKALGKSPG